MRFVQTLFLLTASFLLTACGSLIKPSSPEVSPLVTASCPKLTPLSDDSFGAVTAKLSEVAGIYYECRAAAGVKD